MLWLEFQWHNLLASFSPCLQINILNSLFAGGGGHWIWRTVGTSAQRNYSHRIGEEYSAKDWHVCHLFSGESETHITKHCLNQSHLLENQRLREVDPNGVVFIEKLRSFEPRISDNVGTNFSVGERMRVRRHERKKRARNATLVVADLFIKLPSLQHLHNSSTENTVLDTINDNSEKAFLHNNNSKKSCKKR